MGQEAVAGFSAVVLTWRDVTRTVRCVRSLLQSPSLDMVIVVDNESSRALGGALAEPIESGRCRLIENRENLGFAAGVNTGLRAAVALGANYILVINNDATIDPRSVDLLLLAAAGSGLALAAPRVVHPDGTRERSWGRLTRTMALDREIPHECADYFTWACVVIRADALERIGFLDESFFMYWEDVDFGLRLRRAGLAASLVPGANVVHTTSSSHSNAGSLVQGYSSHGLMVLSIREGRRRWGLARVAARVVRAAVRCQWRAAQCITVGAHQACRPLDGPAWETLPIELSSVTRQPTVRSR
ncbi:MAG: glycosyltransferase family 2 protein [Propionibacteriaceae bacterium]|jgi:GT2 family glycosyltransferase|nr:glycosyltransferase family 2 protein [Propionibacteriaceae bacterium]